MVKKWFSWGSSLRFLVTLGYPPKCKYFVIWEYFSDAFISWFMFGILGYFGILNYFFISYSTFYRCAPISQGIKALSEVGTVEYLGYYTSFLVAFRSFFFELLIRRILYLANRSTYKRDKSTTVFRFSFLLLFCIQNFHRFTIPGNTPWVWYLIEKV